MLFRKTLCILLFLLGLHFYADAQAIYEEDRYVPETDALVLKKLKQWQGLKFGLLMHWGTYSQWGIVESWSICPEEYEWCARTEGKNPQNYFAYKKEYEDLKTTFNPVKFDPAKWAAAAKKAGMKYVVFTTKHHDGFSMFDTKYTDYKITDKDCPFSNNPKANIAKEVFDAFRKEGLWTGAYFSKPDWHSPLYWDPYYPPRDRNVNYDPEANPEKWQKFTDFTHNQIMELMTDYGKMDILWLDGGWVAKTSKKEIEDFYINGLKDNKTGYLKNRIVNQDIKMDELVEKARKAQPGLIVVDRAVHGKNQNYLTPENKIPEKQLPYPWESCIISGESWSYKRNANYLSSREVVSILTDIVAKGGNLLLNIAPAPDGSWDEGAYKMLDGVAKWMAVNNEAIYETHARAPYKLDNVRITEKEDGTLYLIVPVEKDQKSIPAEIIFPGHTKKIANASILGFNKNLKFQRTASGLTIDIPQNMESDLLKTDAWTIKLK